MLFIKPTLELNIKDYQIFKNKQNINADIEAMLISDPAVFANSFDNFVNYFSIDNINQFNDIDNIKEFNFTNYFSNNIDNHSKINDIITEFCF
jgi:hypothetical protein